LIAQHEALAYDLGLRPWEFWQCTPAELDRLVQAEVRRRSRQADARAWMVAHVMAALGTVPKGLRRVDQVQHWLLGRAPGTVPGEARAAAPTGAMSPMQSAEYAALWVRALGGQDRRSGATGGER
jgi:hypothetical protein